MDKTTIERPDFHLKIVQEISDLVNQYSGLDNILKSIVNKIADSLHLDVASIYLWDDEENELVLKSTRGLHIDPEKPIKLKPGEGLTGVVYKNKSPLISMPASKHPEYKYFPESGEKEYESYIGVPILLHNRCIGVLVAQTKEQRFINPAEETLFLIIASRLAGLFEVADRLERLKPQTDSKLYQGKGVSEEYAVGHVYLLKGLFQEFPMDEFEPQGVEQEGARLIDALESVEADMESLIHRLNEEGGKLSEAEINIFDSHILILKDSTFRNTILGVIEEKGSTAEVAIMEGIESIAGHFERLEDRYLRERAIDIREIGEKVLHYLIHERGVDHIEPKPGDGAVVVGRNIGPSLLATMLKSNISAIVTEQGGETSHMAILAQSLGIPAVYGIKNVDNLVVPGQRLLVDGKTGFVFLNPDNELIEEYERAYKQHIKLLEIVEKEGAQDDKAPFPIEISANIGFPVDVEMAKRYKLTDVGLFRTEFAFTLFNSWPTVAEQVTAYENVAKNFEGYTTLRTLDVGADKPLPYFVFPEEENPLLGLRAVRFSMEYLDLFRDQIRAVMILIKKGYRFRILLPLVTQIWEVETAHEIIEEISEELGLARSQIPPLGIMMEVPALLYQLSDYMDIIDFVSIGTNDLIQYLLAVDRNSNIVGHLYSPFHPAIIRTLDDILIKTQDLDKHPTICGEMAGTPRGALALLSIGYRSFSVLPSRSPIIRHLSRRTEPELLQNVRERILGEKREADINRYLGEVIESIDPILLELE